MRYFQASYCSTRATEACFVTSLYKLSESAPTILTIVQFTESHRNLFCCLNSCGVLNKITTCYFIEYYLDKPRPSF